jgi:FimV-like protein
MLPAWTMSLTSLPIPMKTRPSWILARAYIDMGDMEGARDILQEVLNEGNGSQKDEAKGLLAQVG